LELRKTNRYALRARACLSWEGTGGLEESEGLTRDISSRGVFISCEAVPPLGAHLELDVYLPSPSGSLSSAQLHGEGTVLRVEQETAAGKGFAAEVIFQTEPASSFSVFQPRSKQ
jgi:hypothetical protein